jgi:hypothetical protein
MLSRSAFFSVIGVIRRFIGMRVDGGSARPHRAHTNAQRQCRRSDHNQFFVHGNSSAPCHRAVLKKMKFKG